MSGPGARQISTTAPSDGTASLAVGDLTGDGNLDLVVANNSGSPTGSVAILYGNGDGTFQAPVNIDTGVGFSTEGHAMFAPAPGSPFPLDPSSNGSIDAMTVANLTGHGNLDLVLSSSPAGGGSGKCGTSDCVQVLTNTDDGTGSFNPVAAYAVNGEGQVAAADLRGIGVDDVLVPADVQNGVSGTGGFEVLLNDGTGALDPPALFTYPGSSNPKALVVGDFNNDRKLDVAMADFTSSITVLFEGNGDGTFAYDDTVPDPLGLQSTDNALVAADFNGDCKLDLGAGDYDGGLVVMRNDTPPAGSACPKPPTPPPITTPTTPTTSPVAVVPPTLSKPPVKPKPRIHVTQRISITVRSDRVHDLGGAAAHQDRALAPGRRERPDRSGQTGGEGGDRGQARRPANRGEPPAHVLADRTA